MKISLLLEFYSAVEKKSLEVFIKESRQSNTRGTDAILRSEIKGLMHPAAARS